MKYTLRKSIKVSTGSDSKPKEKKVLNINFDTMKGSHLVEAEREYHLNGGIPQAQLSHNFQFCMCLASKVIGINYYEFVEISAIDAQNIVREIQAFLLEIPQLSLSGESASTVEKPQKQE